jgi:hypothetical protein
MEPYSKVILFAIQAAVRLEGQMKSAQIEQIKKHTLNLVTPKFSGLVNERSATTWFMNDGKNAISGNTRLSELTQKARFDTRNMTKEENKELVDAYIRIRNLEEGHVKFDNISLSKNNIYALTSIQQWADGTNPNPSPLQRVAGSLVEIGVDYFRNFSHLASTTSSQGKLLMSFLDAIDDVNFAEGQLDDIATSFMTATIETLDSSVGLIGGDSNTSALLKSVAKGVIQDVNTYIKTTGSGNLLKQSEAKEWGQLIFKSVLSTAGTEVLSNPNTFLGTKGTSSEMITSVGNSLLNGILTDIDAGNGVVVSLKNVFTTSTLDSVSKAAFQVFAEHPEWYAVDNQGLQNILTSLVKTVATYPNQFGMDMIPDLVNLILGQTAGNLTLIYQGDPSKPANNLLLKTTSLVLKTLQNAVPKEAGQKWQPVFTKSQTLGLIDMTLQEVIANPNWILTSAAKANPMLEDVLNSVFKSLQGVSLVGMSTSTKMNIIKSAIETVAVNQGLLEKFNIDGQEKALLNYGIDIALSFAFGEKATAKSKWALASGNALNMLTEAVLVRLSNEGASESVVALTKEFLESEMEALTNGQGVNIQDIASRLKSGDTLQTLLQNSVNAATRISATIIAENPGLLGIQNEDVKNLVSHLASSLSAYPTAFSAAILPDLARMLILDTSENIGLIVGSEPSNNLLAQASSIVIHTLLPLDGNGNTKFNFSANQILSLTDDVLQLVVSKPEWILTKAANVDPLLSTALSAVFGTLNGASVLNLSNESKINIMRSALQAVGEDKRFMQAVGIDNELMMTLAMNAVINTVQGKLTGDASGSAGLNLTPEGITKLLTETAVDNIKWALSDNSTIEKLSESVLSRLAKEGASEEALALTNTLIANEVIKIAKGEPFSLENLLSQLESPEQLSDIIAAFSTGGN